MKAQVTFHQRQSIAPALPRTRAACINIIVFTVDELMAPVFVHRGSADDILQLLLSSNIDP